MSNDTVILRMGDEAVKRMARVASAHCQGLLEGFGTFTIRCQIGDDLSQPHWIRLDPTDSALVHALSKLEGKLDLLHARFGAKHREDFTTLFANVHVDVVQAEHVWSAVS